MAVRRLAETQPESFAFTQENRAWAERVPAGGTAFRFTLPLEEAPTVPPEAD